MATAYKVLGQTTPSASTNTTLYTVPAATEMVLSSLVVCNQDTSSCTIRIAIRPDGESIAAKHYLVYDATVAAKQTIAFTLGITANASDVITVWSSNASSSFNAFGSEIS